MLKGIVSGWIWLKFKLIQALMYVIVTCIYEKDPIKNSQEKVATLFSPLQVYEDFFRRSRAANSSQWLDNAEILTPPSFHACHGYLQVWKGWDEKQLWKSGNLVFPIITLSVAIETSSRIWLNFKLIQALMYVIVTCKYEKDPIKNSQEKVASLFFPYFFQTLKGSLLNSRWLDLAEFQKPPTSHKCHGYLQVRKWLDEKQPRESGNTVFPITTLWELSVAMETRVLNRSAPKPKAAFPSPKWCFR